VVVDGGGQNRAGAATAVMGDADVAGDDGGGGGGQGRCPRWLVLVGSTTTTALPSSSSLSVWVVVDWISYAPGRHPLPPPRSHLPSSLIPLDLPVVVVRGLAGGGRGGRRCGCRAAAVVEVVGSVWKRVESVVGTSAVGKRAAGADCGKPCGGSYSTG
jgi:hypothetical protein